MDEKRLHQLIDAYGASPARWPDDERADALELLVRSPAAQHARDAAAALDDLLDASAVAATPSPALEARVVAAALQATAPRVRDRRPPAPPHRLRRVAAVLVPLAAAAGIVLWLERPASPPAADSRSATLALASRLDDLATTPSDALLDVGGLRARDVEPSYGCVVGELGCPELDPSLTDRQSTRDTGRARA